MAFHHQNPVSVTALSIPLDTRLFVIYHFLSHLAPTLLRCFPSPPAPTLLRHFRHFPIPSCSAIAPTFPTFSHPHLAPPLLRHFRHFPIPPCSDVAPTFPTFSCLRGNWPCLIVLPSPFAKTVSAPIIYGVFTIFSFIFSFII